MPETQRDDDATQKLVDELSDRARFSSTEHGDDPWWRGHAQGLRDAAFEIERAAQRPPVAEPDNHHNADLCPFCTRNRDEREAAIRAEALAQSPPVSEDVRDLVDDLRESASQSYEELSQATIDVLNRAADYIAQRPPVSPERRETLAQVIHPEAWVDSAPGAVFEEPEAQARYERFFAEAVATRRAPSLASADAILARFSLPVLDAEKVAQWLRSHDDYGVYRDGYLDAENIAAALVADLHTLTVDGTPSDTETSGELAAAAARLEALSPRLTYLQEHQLVADIQLLLNAVRATRPAPPKKGTIT